MDMILLDWTRMARSYCLAGVTIDGSGYRIVRPLPTKYYGSSMANAGWSAYLLDGHSRWEIFELVDPHPAAYTAPHVEDVWVRNLRPRRRVADARQRQAILTATKPPADEPLFGTPLSTTAGAAYVESGSGQRSLATVWVPANQIVFSGSRRGPNEPVEVRVGLGLAGLDDRLLSVKDHHLLARANQKGHALDGQLQAMQQIVRQMGDPVAVRLGLSRPFVNGERKDAGRCWVMADGFFSVSDPQP